MAGPQKVFMGVIGILVLGGFLVLGGLIATDPGDNTRLISVGTRQDSIGQRFVTGVIENTTKGGVYALVQLDIDLLNKEGAVVRTAIAEKSDFRSGERWSFEVAILEESAVQARLKKLSCSKAGEEPHPRACYIKAAIVELPAPF